MGYLTRLPESYPEGVQTGSVHASGRLPFSGRTISVHPMPFWAPIHAQPPVQFLHPASCRFLIPKPTFSVLVRYS